MDLRKAVDSVDYNILVEKLRYYGLCGVSSAFPRSHLSNNQDHIKALIALIGILKVSAIDNSLCNLYIHDINNLTSRLN